MGWPGLKTNVTWDYHCCKQVIVLLSLQTHNSYAIVAHIIVLLLLHTHNSVAIVAHTS